MSLRSPIRRLHDLVGSPPLDVGTVTSVVDSVATIALIGGGTITARGAASVGQRVYVRGSEIVGPAPALIVESVEV